MNKSFIYTFFTLSLITGQLLTAAAAPQPLSEQDISMIKNIITLHLSNAEQFLKIAAQYHRLIMQVQRKERAVSDQEIRSMLAQYIKSYRKYEVSLGQVLKTRARLFREGNENDGRLISLWQAIDAHKNLIDQAQDDIALIRIRP